MTTEIPLTQGRVALVDDEDAALVLASGNWRALRNRTIFYAARHIRRTDGRRTTQRMHTLLTGWPYVDHVNGNGLDNRRANLRPATNQENQRNRGKQENNTSGFKGVGWHKRIGKWQASVRVDGRLVHLGYHATPEAAARAYDAAALEHHGEFAHLNFSPQETA